MRRWVASFTRTSMTSVRCSCSQRSDLCWENLPVSYSLPMDRSRAARCTEQLKQCATQTHTDQHMTDHRVVHSHRHSAAYTLPSTATAAQSKHGHAHKTHRIYRLEASPTSYVPSSPPGCPPPSPPSPLLPPPPPCPPPPPMGMQLRATLSNSFSISGAQRVKGCSQNL